MNKSIFIIIVSSIFATGYGNISEQKYEPISFEQKVESDIHPYINFGVGSVAVGVQTGLFQQSYNHGFDVRVGAGSVLFVSGASAHANYLRFPEIQGKREYFIGAGVGACYLNTFAIDMSSTDFYAGPNLTFGRKFTNDKGKTRIVDVNLLFPVNQKEGERCIPTLSTGWMF